MTSQPDAGEPSIGIVAAAQKAILAHPYFDGGAAVAFGFANAAVKAALAATPAVGMIITDTMIEAGARIHNPFAFDGDAPLHRAQSRDEVRREVHAILSAALAAMPTVDATQGALALYLNEVQPVVDGRVQINVSIDELTVLRHLAGAAPAVGGEARKWIVDLIHSEYDPKPSDYRPGDNWNDGAEEIADQILERLRNV